MGIAQSTDVIKEVLEIFDFNPEEILAVLNEFNASALNSSALVNTRSHEAVAMTGIETGVPTSDMQKLAAYIYSTYPQLTTDFRDKKANYKDEVMRRIKDYISDDTAVATCYSEFENLVTILPPRGRVMKKMGEIVRGTAKMTDDVSFNRGEVDRVLTATKEFSPEQICGFIDINYPLEEFTRK